MKSLKRKRLKSSKKNNSTNMAALKQPINRRVKQTLLAGHLTLGLPIHSIPIYKRQKGKKNIYISDERVVGERRKDNRRGKNLTPQLYENDTGNTQDRLLKISANALPNLREPKPQILTFSNTGSVFYERRFGKGKRSTDKTK